MSSLFKIPSNRIYMLLHLFDLSKLTYNIKAEKDDILYEKGCHP
jgi:hypothetical protein